MGKWRFAIVVLGLALASNACAGTADPEIVVQNCSYSGPETMSAGTIPVAMSVSGLGSRGLHILEIDERHSYADLEDYYDESDNPVESPPEWVRAKTTIQVGDLFAEASESRSVTFSEGEYAAVCVNYPYDSDDPTEGELMARIVVTAP